MDNCDEKPPSHKIAFAGDMDTGSADIPPNDIKGKPRVGFWHKFIQPILYPAGSSVCSRCIGLYMSIR